MTIRKFAAAVNNSWDYGLVGTELSDWCHSCPSSAAQLIERLRGESTARLKIINKKLEEIDQWRMIVVNLESQIEGARADSHSGLLSSDNPYSHRDEIEKWLGWDTAWHQLALAVADMTKDRKSKA